MSSPSRRSLLQFLLSALVAPLGLACGKQAKVPNVTRENCLECNGSGRITGPCAVCGGSGSRGVGGVRPIWCQSCGGGGSVSMNCRTCSGTGKKLAS